MVITDFARCPENVLPADYIRNIFSEFSRNGMRAPAHVDAILVVIAADIGNDNYIRRETNLYYSLLRELFANGFVKPFYVIYNCHELHPVPRHDHLVQAGSRRFSNLLAPDGRSLCRGVFTIAAAPRQPITPVCPRNNQHEVSMRVNGLLRYCPTCHKAEVCSGGVELPEVVT